MEEKKVDRRDEDRETTEKCRQFLIFQQSLNYLIWKGTLKINLDMTTHPPPPPKKKK